MQLCVILHCSIQKVESMHYYDEKEIKCMQQFQFMHVYIW